MTYADIIVDISHEKLDKSFQYLVPEKLKEEIQVGMVVSIPFGRGNHVRKGYVVGISGEPKVKGIQLKSVAGIENDQETTESRLIALAGWMKENYGSTMIQALKTVLPIQKKIKAQEKRWITLLISREDGEKLLEELSMTRFKARIRLLEALLQNENGKIETAWASKELGTTASVLRYFEEQGIASVESDEVYRNAVADAEKALEACVATANLDDYRGIGLYKKLGYIPYNIKDEYNAENWSLSKTLEYAFDDYCIAEMARKMGRTQLADEFYKRSQNYRNVFNPASSFMQPIDDKGIFQPNFSPDDYTAHICESNGWQYFWSVQQDIKGLIALTGGKDRFTEKLDSMFTYIPASNADLPLFSTGMIGQYAHGNEPSHHVIYLYNKVRQPWKTQKYAAQVMHDLYFNAPAGLCGNEDCGQMSAWYVFSAMGFYPVNPVSGEYEIGTPLFSEIQMHLDNGKTFTVLAPGVSRENIYIQSVKVNGQPYDKSYITHRQIMDGATVEFEMGPEPGNIWYR